MGCKKCGGNKHKRQMMAATKTSPPQQIRTIPDENGKIIIVGIRSNIELNGAFVRAGETVRMTELQATNLIERNVPIWIVG